MEEKNIIIVGGGVSGLVACINLQNKLKDNYKITLIEKNNFLGGRLNRKYKHHYQFNNGPSWYILPDLYQKIFHGIPKEIGIHLGKPLQMKHLFI